MPRAEYGGVGYVIEGTEVSFANRDVTQCTDREYQILCDLVEIEHDHEGKSRTVESMIIESDHLDKDIVRFRTSVRSKVYLQDMYEE